MVRSPSAALLALGCVLAGCQGQIGAPVPGVGPPQRPGPVPGQPNPDPSPNPDPTPGTPPDYSFRCDPAAPVSVTPLRRLSVLQYENTLADLFQNIAGLDPIAVARAGLAALPPDDVGSTFRGLDARLSDRHVQAFYDVADAVAAAVIAADPPLIALAGRCALDALPTAACVDTFLDGFALRVFRRPLTLEERARYQALNDGTRDGRELFRSLVFSLLMAPQFLYHTEVDGSAVGTSNSLSLSAHELASRLSYHFWQSMPDAELLSAASDGSILTEAGYAAEVARVFADPKTQRTMSTFYAEWFQTGAITNFRRSPAFDSFIAGTGIDDPGADYLPAAADEIDQLTAYYTWTAPGSFRDLLLTDLSFTRSPYLAQSYGVDPWDGTSAQPRLPSTERAGLLTRVAFLLSGTHTTHPIHRGAVVRRRLLCDQLVAPDPATLPPGSLVPPPPDPSQTTRQRFANKVLSEPCASCHRMMNPIGYVLERYDALGRYRTVEHIFDEATGAEVNALPIDSRSTPGIVPGDPTEIETGPELSRLVADSGRAEPCFARQYFRFTHHREEVVAEDACTLESVRAAVSGGNLRDALMAIALSPSFRARRVE